MAYPGIENLTDTSVTGIMGYPNIIGNTFFGSIFLALWLVLTLNPYFRNKERFGFANFLSHGAVSSFVIIVLAGLGTLAGLVTADLFKYIMALGVALIGLWFFSTRN